MKKYSKEEIEQLYLETMQGFYLSQCAKNGGDDAVGFYENQLGEFTAGFECCTNIALNAK